LQGLSIHIILEAYPLKNTFLTKNPLLMKASALDVQSHLSLSKVITRLVLLGGIILGGMVGLLTLCSSVFKIFQ